MKNNTVIENNNKARAQPGGAKGAKALLSQVKVEKKDKKFLMFSWFRAYNPIKMLLQHHHIFPVI